jgi:hypothetical protein
MSNEMANWHSDTLVDERNIQVRGEMVNRAAWAPLRVLAIVTGLFLVRGILALFGRYCLGLRRRACAQVEGRTLVLAVEWSILGKKIKETRTIAPITDLKAVRLENRQRYLHLLIGFGALVTSAWIGIQWFVNGLRAGYPYLALVGAGIVAAGVLIDLFLYFVVPSANGSSRILIALGPWEVRLAGVDPDKASAFVAQMQSAFEKNTKLDS